ncbi:rod shape-determining protein RodA, partial [Vibrio harveyi]
ISAW